MTHGTARALAAAALLALPFVARAETLHRYEVAVTSDLGEVRVHACFDGAAPARLVSAAPQAARFLHDPRLAGDPPRALEYDGNGIVVPAGTAPSACVDYAVDLAAAVRAELGRFAQRWQRDLTTTPALWLWRPRPPGVGGARDADGAAGAEDGTDADIEVSFTLPKGIAVSAPWQLVPRSETNTVYRIGHTPEDWPGIVAFGRFRIDDVAVPGAILRVTLIDGDPSADPRVADAWVEHAARAVATLYGEFPLASPQILLFPRGPSDVPVPWGQVVRGGGAAAQLYYDQHRSLAELDADWTATHELSHMLLPDLDPGDTWLSEGFASYYQNVLRARAGMLTREQAWKELAGGFERGRTDARDGETLAETTRNMRSERAFMRVYWSGAAYVLLADVRLRAESGGRQSLDTALVEFKRCCLPADRYWSAAELLAKLEAITGTKIFTEIAAQVVDSREFPDVSGAFRELGLYIEDGALHFDDDAAHAALRDVIMAPRAAAAGVEAVSSRDPR
jgi:hypothetical protein